MNRRSIWTKYGFAWVTLALFMLTLTGHWIFGWFAYVNEQLAHQQSVKIGDYTVQMMRDTLENWQSEFLQLLCRLPASPFYCTSARRNRRRAMIGWRPRSTPSCSLSSPRRATSS
jgi:hypothetical protein